MQRIGKDLGPHPATRAAPGEAGHIHRGAGRAQFVDVGQVAVDHALVQRPHHMGFGMPTSDSVKASAGRRLYVGAVEEGVEDDVGSTGRQAGDHLVAHFIDRDAPLLSLDALLATEVVDEPLQVGSRGGTRLYGQPQARDGVDGGHEQGRVYQRLGGDDFVDAPRTGDDAHLTGIDHPGP